jgi:hypothetical protein
MFARMFRHSPATRAARNRKQYLTVDALEGRQLMSLGAEFPVSVPTPAAQAQSANASSANGSSVVVWTESTPSTSQIMGQLLNSQGGKVGAALTIASVPGLNEAQPSVAMDAHGNFVVSWTEFLPSGGSDILAQKFNAAGAPVGAVVPVAVGTFPQTSSSVAMDAQGDFVVSYTRDTNDNDPNIFAKLYNTNGQLLNVVTVAGAPQDSDLSSVAMSPNGQFDVAWEVQFSRSSVEVMAARYTASGGLLQQVVVAGATPLSLSPKIAMDNHGNAVIVYQQEVPIQGLPVPRVDFDIEARRLSSTGVLSSEINIADSSNIIPSTIDTDPSVALEGNAGAFVVAYDHGSSVSGVSVDVAEVNSSNVVIDTFSAGQTEADAVYVPGISIDAQNEFLVTFLSLSGNDNVIVGRRGLL